ncbi:MAG: hypothetical protein EOM20_14270 [Spartobacteria bacterium]|nr:hypothetical protein [Spartobacteria bacterium]
MAKQAGQECLTTVVGGISVRITSVDTSLLVRLIEYMDAEEMDIPIDVTLRVEQVGEAGSPEVLSLGASFSDCIEGENEYTAYLNHSGTSVLLLLHGEYPLEATMNCLRQVIRRRIYSEGGIVLHAACIRQGSDAYLFYGPSGAGKSTVCSFAAAGHVVLSDDLTCLKRKAGGWVCWGMPGVVRNPNPESTPVYTGTPLKAVIRLIQASTTKLAPLHKSLALASLMAVPFEDTRFDMGFGIMEKVNRLVEDVPCYSLHFRKDPEFWDVISQQIGQAS